MERAVAQESMKEVVERKDVRLILEEEHLYLDGFSAFDVCSGRRDVGAAWDMFRNLIGDWSQEVT